jgi:predicted nuclease of predicted toxin-antitoxin system
MIRLLADENFDNRILRGIRRENAEIDIVRVQDTEVYSADDPTVLDWATKEGQVLLTHDMKTMPKFAYDRIREGKSFLGVIIVAPDTSIGQIIEDILIVVGTSESDDLESQVLFLPL